MKKRHLAIAFASTLFVAGCSSTGDGALLSALNQFSKILDGAMPLVQESEEWEKYSIEKTQQGVIYGVANNADKQFVSKKFDAEYPAAIDRLSRPFALDKEAVKELEAANTGYHFKFNQIMPVKNKSNANIIGYCVNFDVNRWENGKPTASDAPGNVQKQFIYAAKDRPLSTTTANKEFTERMCGKDFYSKYKNPNS